MSCAWPSAVSSLTLTSNNDELSMVGFASEIASKAASRLIGLTSATKTRACQYALKSVARDAEPRHEPANEKTDFGTTHASIHMCFIENQRKLISWVGG
jgi:hypothetical protein